jgi:hypothetical protein
VGKHLKLQLQGREIEGELVRVQKEFLTVKETKTGKHLLIGRTQIGVIDWASE